MTRNLSNLIIALVFSICGGALGQQPSQTLNLSGQMGGIGGGMGGQQSGGIIPFSGGGNQQGGFFGGQNQQGGSSQNQQGGSVAALTATNINNGYSQGTRVQIAGTSVRLNLRLLPQRRQQVATHRQYRLNLRLGRHGFIQANNSGGTTGGGTTGGGTTGGGTTGGGTTGGGTTGGGTTGGEIPTGAVGMQAATPR